MTAARAKYRPLWIAALALVLLPLVMRLFGLTVNTACVVVIFAIAAIGLNLLVGYTGLISFGHSAWFGIGGYAAALAQKHWFAHQIAVPLIFGVLFVAALSLASGILILRRRGVYFSLLTLALAALTYTIVFRWSSLTGGEDGLGGLTRGGFGPLDLDDALIYYALVALIALAVLYALMRVVRSPFGHVLVAIRENQLRATFLGYPVRRYRLAAFVLSAVVTGLAGALLAFQNYLVSADSVSVTLSGELLAMVVIGGMHRMLGPAIGALFFILFRELFSIWTANWLFWFGLLFVGFVLYSPEGLVGILDKVKRRGAAAGEADALSRRQSAEELPLPAFLRPASAHATRLDVEGVSKHFGGIRAVSNASLTVGAREIHALIGPNGAGKTTLFNLVSGLYVPDTGAVRLNGHAVHGLPIHRICEAGVARSFQITNLFRKLSVHENLRLALQARHPGRFDAWHDVDSFAKVQAETAELIRFIGLIEVAGLEAGTLSYGSQRLLDLGIALGGKPHILLLDEPLAGLAAAERERVSRLVKNAAATIPVLIVEHDIDRVLELSQRVTVMNQSEVLMAGSPAEVRADPRVQEVYTGTGRPPVTGRRAERIGDARLLRVERLNTGYGKSHVLRDVALDVRDGEIVALLGRNGAGKTTLLQTLAGLLPAMSGKIEFAGRDITGLPAPDIARRGIGYVPQGRGLFAGMSVADNLALGRLGRTGEGGKGAVWSEEEIFQIFPRLSERRNVAADYLSGGEQQMLAVARALSGNVKLLLLDEPFEGLAPTIVQDLFKVFDLLRGRLSLLIVEHNLDLVLALADRVFALEQGAMIHEGAAAPLLNDLSYRNEVLWL